jgi:hypothetical protein
MPCRHRTGSAALDIEGAPIRTDLRLLTRVRFREPGGRDRACFASVTDLGPRSARIESARALEKGCRVTLQVVFPGQRQYSNRHVDLHYVVAGAHDEDNLHYELEVIEMDEESRERLALFLNRSPSQES